MSEPYRRRVEVVARVLYREWMGDDFDEYPWDDENVPSNETVEEAQGVAQKVVDALADDYQADDRRFEQAVNRAARELLQELVRDLDAR